MVSKSKKVPKKNMPAKKGNAVVTDSVGNYEKHPFFVQKMLAAKALVSQVGLPKQLIKKTQA
jgi:hypothetical protein